MSVKTSTSPTSLMKSLQWAAVTTRLSCTRDPPQNCATIVLAIEAFSSPTWKGLSSGPAGPPPTIRGIRFARFARGTNSKVFAQTRAWT